MDEIKVCFVKFAPKAKKVYLYEMPIDEYLDDGSTVIVTSADGEDIEAEVVDTEKYEEKYELEWESFKRLLMVAGVELPLKRVLGKVKRTYFNYGGEVNADVKES